FNNEVGVFLVDDARGGIGKLHPGDRGYAAAALARGRAYLLAAAGQGAGVGRTLTLPAGRFFGFYLVGNATREQFLARNRTNRVGSSPNVFFSLAKANPDRLEHVRSQPGGVYAFDDQLFGGDRDFNDLVVRLDFGPSPEPIPLPPPVVVPIVPLP